MKLLEPVTLGKLTLKNRIVKSATHETMAGPNGECTERCVEFYRRIARGGAGLLITGNIFHHWVGHNWPGQLGLDCDELIASYRPLTKAVQAEGAAIAAQINDTGREVHARYTRGHEPRAPSAVFEPLFWHRPREMTVEDIHETVESFGHCAARAKAAGFDAVQIHGAHGYLLNQFLSPYTNRRRDQYGGHLPNRWRFVQEVYQSIRRNVGADFPVLIKINATDAFPVPIGVRFGEALETAKMLADLGVDAMEVSCGCYESGMTTIRGPLEFRLALRTVAEAREANALSRAALWALAPLLRNLYPFRENYNLGFAAAVKRQVKAPVITVGGLRRPEVMESILEQGQADLVALARPLIADPDFPRQIAAGDLSPSRCVNCNICIVHIQERPLQCYGGVIPKPARSRP
ncbi:MAG: hypothetical protein A2V67_06515 [Deltaproteobacteria bacterium RBG_13_61_14]|nr:MAG: hypothetical protein A2V67_06515 [Deltaproteobacteria bacterium RBG_13_61_14]